MTINALNSGAKVWLADHEDANTPPWENVIDGQLNLRDAIDRTLDFTSPAGKRYALHDGDLADHRRPAARLAPDREAPPGRRRAAGRGSGRLRPLLLPLRAAAARPRRRTVLLSAQAGESPRGAALERRLRARPGPARHPARHDPGDRADRDLPGRVRDGGDPLRAARTLRRAERRPVGLHVQRDQEVPDPGRGLPAARPERGDDDRAVHAGVHRTARPDLPPARRPRHRRHGGVHPEPARPAGQRDRAGQGARGQDPRGGRRIRRFLGGAPGPGADLPGDLRLPPRRPADTSWTGSAPTSRSPPRNCWTYGTRPARVRKRGCATTSASASSTWPVGWPAPVRWPSTT